MVRTPDLSIVMPVYNEAACVEDALRTTRSTLEASNVDWEIVVVNDGSTDHSPTILESFRYDANGRIRVKTHERNLGIGGALRTGICAAQGVFCMLVPADNPLTQDTLQRFLSVAYTSDLVLGWRPERPGYTWLMKFNSIFYHLLLRLFFGVAVRDVNWQHFYRRSIFEQIDIESNGVVIAAEVVIKAQRLGLSIAEVLCPMRRRSGRIASAARPIVMFRTATEFIRFFWRWYFGNKRALSPHGLLRPDTDRSLSTFDSASSKTSSR